MSKRLLLYLLLAVATSALAKDEAELPLCPTDFQYFPQNLPLHCRMPASASDNNTQTAVAQYPSSSFYQNAQAYPMQQFSAGHMFPPLAPMAPVIPLTPPQPAHKLPVIVMPFYAPDKNFHKDPHAAHRKVKVPIKGKRKDRYDSSDTDTDTSSSTDDTDTSSSDTSKDHSGSNSDKGFWRQRKNKRRPSGRRSNRRFRRRDKTILTPIIQYITKDGYVIYEKEISKSEAKDWLNEKQGRDDNNLDVEEEETFIEQNEQPEQTVQTVQVEPEKEVVQEVEKDEYLELVTTQKPENEKREPVVLKTKKAMRQLAMRKQSRRF